MSPAYVTSASPVQLDLSNFLSTWLGPVCWQFATDAARSLIQRNGLNHIDGLFELSKTSIHSHNGRTVSPLELWDENGERVEAFVKLSWGRRRLIPRMAEIKSRQAYLCLPTLEWNGIEHLKSLGLQVPERLALVRSGRIWFREAVIIRRVPPPHSVDDLIRSGQWDAFSRENQQALLEGMVDVMQSIHQAGYGWRGTCTRHFFPEPSAEGTWKFWLIDCEGVHHHITPRAINRDYRKLRRALEISGANPWTLQWFQQLVDRAKQTPKTPNPPQPKKGFLPKLHPTLEPST